MATDQNGKEVWQRQLDIYGKTRKLEGESSLIPFLYQGQYYDEETGLAYNRFRYYSPDTGMYLSQDPIGLAGGMPNMYAYVSDSNAWIDPLGLSGLPKVFWSGGDKAKAAAQSYAESIGGEVLEMTPQGKALEKWTKNMEWDYAEPLWKKTSQNFAGSAPSSQKHAVVFIDSNRYRGAGSVWESIEKPILDKKGITTEVRDVNKIKAGCH